MSDGALQTGTWVASHGPTRRAPRLKDVVRLVALDVREGDVRSSLPVAPAARRRPAAVIDKVTAACTR
ncbi:hypothetical protein J2Z21_004275 [Streptomyces griseochromogenes]|uniref:Uncharacterized protein n=1 Tax=Streptomyces griseochromogenes TaxID=68214 RepID=A0A1B1AVC2_9ACTN|nr:hypothetical protein [Streptomyces griseochromogenes]ANP50539.1 hypothetical protein AVL59_13725 [Streptomyces griseochromogenes]MBP2051304.1 hypothetical protein [Streptomyces griseochromogenes]